MLGSGAHTHTYMLSGGVNDCAARQPPKNVKIDFSFPLRRVFQSELQLNDMPPPFCKSWGHALKWNCTALIFRIATVLRRFLRDLPTKWMVCSRRALEVEKGGEMVCEL